MSTRSRSAGIIGIDLNTISNPDSQTANIDLNSREGPSEEVRDIWRDERMRVGAHLEGLYAYNPMF